MCTCTRTHTHTHTHAHTHTCAHTRAHAHTRTHIHTQHACTHTHAYIHTYTQTGAHTRAHIHTHTHNTHYCFACCIFNESIIPHNYTIYITIEIQSTYYRIMQIVRGGKVSRLHDFLVIRGKTIVIVQQFETPYG